MPNPYAPPATDAPPAQARWWRRPSLWLAWIEIIFGLLLGLGSCAICLSKDESMAGIAAVFSFGISFVFVVVPGALLFVRHPIRWLGQALPLLLVGMAVWQIARP